MQNLKMSKMINIMKPEYVYLKLTPNNSIRNQSTYKIARTVASIYKNVFQRIKKEESKLIKMMGKEFLIGSKFTFNLYEKVGYFIYIEKKVINFYFIVPKHHVSLIKERMLSVWENVTVKQVDEIPKFSNQAEKKYLTYEKEDPMSLKSDKRSNDLLRSNLNIVNVLGEDDKVGIFYNFIPTSQHTWRSKYRYTITKFENGEPIDRNKGKVSYVLKYSFIMLSSLIHDILNVFNDEKKENNMMDHIVNRLTGKRDLSEETRRKENDIIMKAQIVVFSESDDKVRKHSNLKSITQSFDAIAGDNRLVAKRLSKEINFNSFKINGAAENLVSDNECNNFLSLAGREILEEYDFMEKVDTKETQIPEELQKGKFRLGVSTYRGHQMPAYLTENKEYKHLSLFLIGPSRAGKTTLIGNLSKDAIENDECVILFDFIENCEMSTQVASLFPKDKVLNIECDSKEKAQGMGYNEIRFSMDPAQQYINAKNQQTQLSTLINSVNTDDAPLTARMRRYLTSAALVVFLADGPIKDVFAVLQNHNKRHEYISKVKAELMEEMQEYLEYLHELDDRDKEGSIKGTKLSSVEGIISRLNLLKDNPYMELMLKKNTKGNVDLVKEMEQNKLICIKMPEHMFNTDEERDVYCIYWITKIWLALQIRSKLIPDKDKRKKVNLFIDEMYQVQNTESFISEKLSRFAKFRLKPIISCHYLNQLKHIKKELAGANASYLLISGCDKDNFNELQDNLRPFTIEDLLSLKQYHSMNLIKTDDGYARFITKLPAPVK